MSVLSAGWCAPTPGGGWEPGIGDPTVLGWLTVVAYFAGSWLCARSARVVRSTRPRDRRTAGFWTILAIVLALAGINKQLDLQSLLTEIGRELAFKQGWYEQRQQVQVAFIAAVLVGALLTLIGLWWMIRDSGPAPKLALFGSVTLAAFVIVRASSFHHMDRLIGFELFGARVNWILELGGIGCVCAAARMEDHGGRSRRGKRKRDR